MKQQVSAFNESVIERLDDTNFVLEHIEGAFTLLDDYKNEYDLSEWDPAYGGNEVDDMDIDHFDKYIGSCVILDNRDGNGRNKP